MPPVRFPRNKGNHEPLVYVAQCQASGRLKVGYSVNLRTRIASLQSAAEASGVVLLVGWWRVPTRELRFGPYNWMVLQWEPRAAEIDLHARLHASLIHGEWFHGDARALKTIRRLLSRKELPSPPRAAWRAGAEGGGTRRQWLEAFYGELAATGSYAKAQLAGEETANARARRFKLKQQINTVRAANRKLLGRHCVEAA